MVMSPIRRRSVQCCEFVVEGKPMECVSIYITHLGHLLTDRLDDSCIIPCSLFLKGEDRSITLCLQKQCSDVKYYFSVTVRFVPAIMDVSYGICCDMSWFICVLLEERALGDYGAYHQIRTDVLVLYYINV